jgi:hypothetical protein
MGYFTVFIDDSGTAPDHKIAVAAALVIPASRLIALEREWDSLKEKEGFSDFHTSEYVAKIHSQQFATCDEEKHKRVFVRVRQIIKKFGAKVFSFGVQKRDYDEVVPANLRQYIGQHYTWCVRHTITQLVTWRAFHRVEFPLQYVFDHIEKRDPCRAEIETVMEQGNRNLLERGFDEGEYNHYSFESRRKFPGLQCADYVAWMAYQLGQLGFLKKPLHPFAELAWNGLTTNIHGDIAGPTEWITASTVLRKDLEKWMDDEMRDGKILRQFQRWELEDKNQQTRPG